MTSSDLSSMVKIKLEKKLFENIKNELEDKALEFTLHNELSNSDISNKLNRIRLLISYCISESEDIESINLSFEELRKEKDGYKLQAKRLAEENKWLREELRLNQDRLQQRELDYVEIEESNKSLKFLVELQNNPSFESNIPVRVTKPHEINDNSKPTSAIGDVSNNHQQQTPSQNSNPVSNLQMMSSMTTSNCSNSQNQHLLPIQEVPPRLKTLHNLVIQYAKQGRYEIAIPLCKQTLNDLEQASGHYHADVATMLNILALVYRDKGDFDEAVENLTEALEIRKKTLGSDSPRVAATLNNLSVLYAKQGNHAEAEPLCRDALKIREEVLGLDHPDVARQLNNLALLCQNQAKFNEVDKYYKRALAIYMKHYPSNDANIIKTKNNLASSYIKQNRFPESEVILKEVLNDAMEREWSGYERDGKSKPIWIIADEKERHRNLSMSLMALNTASSIGELSSNNNSNSKPSGGNANNNETNSNGTDSSSLSNKLKMENPPPYGFDIKNKNKEDKIALLTTLKLLSSLYRKQNKHIASDIIDEWLAWAGKSLSKYQLDVKWLSYESSLIHLDLYNSTNTTSNYSVSGSSTNQPHYRSQTLWYTTPSTTPTQIPSLRNNNSSRSNSAINTNCNLSNSGFLVLDNNNTNYSPSYFKNQPKSSVSSISSQVKLSKIPVNVDITSPSKSSNNSDEIQSYLFSNSQQYSKSKYESEKSNVYDHIDKN